MITNPALPGIGGAGLSGVSFFSKLIPSLVGVGFIVGGIIFLFMLITGAIQWISSGGDKAALESARGKISNALIGMIVLFSVFAVVKVVEVFFGIKILTIDITPLIIK